MGFKSANDTNNTNNSNVNQSNSDYKVDDIVFPSKFVYKTIKRIDRNLKKLYSPPSEDGDGMATNDSPVRDDRERFNAILDKVDNLLDVLKSFNRENDSCVYFYLRKDNYTENCFFDKFDGMLNCINECYFGECQNNYEDRIIDTAKMSHLQK